MKSVLLVDDEPVLRRSLCRLLSRMGYSVLEAKDGLQAVSMSAGPIDLMLLDLQLPGLSGLEVLQKVRAHTPALPIVLMTGEPNTKPPTDPHARLLLKPFSKEALRAALHSLNVSD